MGAVKNAKYIYLTAWLSLLAVLVTTSSAGVIESNIARRGDKMPAPVAPSVAMQHLTDEMPHTKALKKTQKEVKSRMKAGMPSLFSDSAPWGDQISGLQSLQEAPPKSDASLLKDPASGSKAKLTGAPSEMSKDRPPLPDLASMTNLGTDSTDDSGTSVTEAEAPANPTSKTTSSNTGTPADTGKNKEAVIDKSSTNTTDKTEGTVTGETSAKPADDTTDASKGEKPNTSAIDTTQKNSTEKTDTTGTSDADKGTAIGETDGDDGAQAGPSTVTKSSLPTTANHNNTFGLQDLKLAQKAESTNNDQQKPTSTCDKKDVRRPWSKASLADRERFLSAVACMATVPGRWTGQRDGHPSHSLYEDFVMFHNFQQPLIHRQAALLPCHRLIVNVWFDAMRKHCGYTGDLLYMDWWTYADRNEVWTTRDFWSDNLYGTANGLVRTGKFSHIQVNYSSQADDHEQVSNVKRPICRKYATLTTKGIPIVSYFTTQFVNTLFTETDYDKFRSKLELTFHQYLHISIGCDLIPTTSPNCPTFWAIHTAVDYLWAVWQEQNGGVNRYKYDGNHGDYDNTPATVTDRCAMLGTWSIDFNVQDLLDVNSKPNCYSYEWSDKVAPRGSR